MTSHSIVASLADALFVSPPSLPAAAQSDATSRPALLGLVRTVGSAAMTHLAAQIDVHRLLLPTDAVDPLRGEQHVRRSRRTGRFVPFRRGA